MTPHNSYNQNGYYPATYVYPASPHPIVFRQYPTVDPATFMSSAKDMEKIMKDASLLLDKMAASRQFSYELMSAAQASQQQKVNTIINSTGITHIPKVRYTPDGLVLEFQSKNQLLHCCSLTLNLRWR
ncbi:hypothetical protein [Bacillus sp. S/N-304-OC-R1]|uniref:hypothetical protein n=1 Tax=Bacillus sp. S/N-304-OC-R1 TaxID=2758034 RepID=UPI001C8D3976|nr:hypothetical protein [Bacillus sp. S/N-304-OC-R1]MBY0124280.1 hypothetical protein [Bacillus sp. S/N-304-OC-R1]